MVQTSGGLGVSAGLHGCVSLPPDLSRSSSHPAKAAQELKTHPAFGIRLISPVFFHPPRPAAPRIAVSVRVTRWCSLSCELFVPCCSGLCLDVVQVLLLAARSPPCSGGTENPPALLSSSGVPTCPSCPTTMVVGLLVTSLHVFFFSYRGERGEMSAVPIGAQPEGNEGAWGDIPGCWCCGEQGQERTWPWWQVRQAGRRGRFARAAWSVSPGGRRVQDALPGRREIHGEGAAGSVADNVSTKHR